MGRPRTDMHRLLELVRLHRMGTSARAICRLLKMGQNTERAYCDAFASAGLLEGDPEDLPDLVRLREAVKSAFAGPVIKQPSSIESWRPRIEEMLERGARPTAIFDRLRLEHDDFVGSLSAVKRLCAKINKAMGVRPGDVAIPVETDPGDVAQVDFGYVGRLYDPDSGVFRRAWVFVMTLGYSRHMWADVVFDQKTETWLDLHVCAFESLGGVPQTIVPDNLKAAVIRAAFGVDEEAALNRSYRELARHYGFKIDPTPPKSPEKKGKTESGVKYVKGNFFKPRGEEAIDDSRSALQAWLLEIAGTRRHGTTGWKPLEVFEKEEQGKLLPLPGTRFELVVWKQATVHKDAHVIFDKRLYSVPWRLVGEQVWVRAMRTTVYVHFNEERVATHDRRGPDYRSTKDEHLPTGRRELRYRSEGYWQKRADAIGEETGRLVRTIFASDDVLKRLRPVQAIVTHLVKFPKERAEAAARRALYFGNHTYKSIRNVLRQGLDYEPLPGARRKTEKSCKQKPRFARSAAELLLPNLPDLENHE